MAAQAAAQAGRWVAAVVGAVKVVEETELERVAGGMAGDAAVEEQLDRVVPQVVARTVVNQTLVDGDHLQE